MHELGIVFHIIDSLKEVGEENHLKQIAGVTLEVGEVSGVLEDYLQSCWRWASDRTELLKGASLTVEQIPAVTFCEEKSVPIAKVNIHILQPEMSLILKR